MQVDPQLEAAALKILYEQESDRPKNLAPRVAAMKANPYVARLHQLWEIIHEALQPRRGE